ncbi:ABC transporter ATP-binding protein [Niallia sp. 03133]|uniref:ABC transporter ATP-binding protein n=1 Tax=Niallia sp. 03133 TaxID=3458060 RepID=UPI004044C92F
MNVIEAVNVKKTFSENTVVDQVSLTIQKGEIFGLLGPNGAGKTTTISMLSAQVETSSGNITVNEFDTNKESAKVKSLVGIVPQDIALYQSLNAYDNLIFFGSLYNLKKKEIVDKTNWLLDIVGLKDRAKEPIKNYSGGMKRRINIVAALLHNPQVVFMDEPTVGIDPQSRNKIYELIRILKDLGVTIVYTTHYMEEAAALCDRIAIMDRGNIITQGTPDELIAKIHGGIVELSMLSTEALEEASDVLKPIDGVVQTSISGEKLSIIVKDTQLSLGIIIETLNNNKIHVDSINIMAPTLETLFLHLTGKQLRD